MADGGGKHEEMPYRMVVPILFSQVKNNPQKIERAPDADHRHDRSGYGIKEGTPAYNHNAPHGDIGQCRNKVPFAGKEYLENDSQCGQPPQYRQQGYAKCAVHIDQQKGGIGTGYQEIDTDVIQNFEYAFCPGMLKTVVKRRKGKKLQKTESIYSGTDDSRSIIAFNGKGYENGNTHDTKDNSEAVYDAVYEL